MSLIFTQYKNGNNKRGLSDLATGFVVLLLFSVKFKLRLKVSVDDLCARLTRRLFAFAFN